MRPLTRDAASCAGKRRSCTAGGVQATAAARVVDTESGKLLAHGTGTCLIAG